MGSAVDYVFRVVILKIYMIFPEREEKVMSKVFFTNMDVTPQMGLLKKVEALMERANLEEVVEENRLIAIKLHFGEYGNLA